MKIVAGDAADAAARADEDNVQVMQNDSNLNGSSSTHYIDSAYVKALVT